MPKKKAAKESPGSIIRQLRKRVRFLEDETEIYARRVAELHADLEQAREAAQQWEKASDRGTTAARQEKELKQMYQRDIASAHEALNGLGALQDPAEQDPALTSLVFRIASLGRGK